MHKRQGFFVHILFGGILALMIPVSVHADIDTRATDVSFVLSRDAEETESSSSSSSSSASSTNTDERNPQSLRHESLLLRITRQTFFTPPIHPSAGSGSASPGSPTRETQSSEPMEAPAASADQMSESNIQTSATPPEKTPYSYDPPSRPSYDQCTLLAPACLLWGIHQDASQALHSAATVLETRNWNAVALWEFIAWILMLMAFAVVLRIAWKTFLKVKRASRNRLTPLRHKKRHSPWYVLNSAIILILFTYAVVVLLEWSGAEEATTVVQFNVTTSTSITMGCSTSVALGTIDDFGDTGAYDDTRAATCFVATTDADGYNLSWNVLTGSGGTATGYLINTTNDTIAPYAPAVSGTPETWVVNADTARWGGRLSSTSTTVDTATWGVDGLSEKWLNIGTGGLAIANRSNATGSSSDIQKIGFRAEIGANVLKSTGTYRTSVTFTATTN